MSTGGPSVEAVSLSGEPLPNYPISFNLATDLGLERTFKRRTQGGFFGFFIAIVCLLFGLGFINLFPVGGFPVGGGNASVGTTLIVGALVLGALLGSLARSVFGGGVDGLSIDEDGFRLSRTNGKTFSARWTDDNLRFNIGELYAPTDHVLPKSDARRTHPQWIEVFAPSSQRVKLETTLPAPAVAALMHEVTRRAIPTRRIRVAYYWYSHGKGAWLANEVEGEVSKGHELNGFQIQVRGKYQAEAGEW